MKRSCSAVSQRTSGCAVRLLPEARDQRAQQQELHEAHAGVRRHLEGAQLDETEPAGRPVGRVQLVDAELGAVRVAGHVDEQVAEQPIDQPRLRRLAGRRALKGDLELVERVVARLVDARRLAGRADEQAGEEVGEARMMLPVGEKAAQQIGPAQDGLSAGVGPPMVTWLPPPVPGVAAVEHELLGAEAALTRFLVERLGDVRQLRPVARRMDVDLDHAGVGRDREAPQARVARRLVAFEQHRHRQLGRRRLDAGEQIDVVLEVR